jgi:hypothetical protein
MFMSHAGGEDEVYRDVLETFVSRRYLLPESSAKLLTITFTGNGSTISGEKCVYRLVSMHGESKSTFLPMHIWAGASKVVNQMRQTRIRHGH